MCALVTFVIHMNTAGVPKTWRARWDRRDIQDT